MLAVINLLLHDVDEPNIAHENSLTQNFFEDSEEDKFDKILMNPPYGSKEDASVQIRFPDELRSSETANLFLAVVMHRLK